MTGKQSSPLCLCYRTVLTVLIVSCLVAVCSSATQESKSTRDLHLDDIGVYFKIIIKEIAITQYGSIYCVYSDGPGVLALCVFVVY